MKKHQRPSVFGSYFSYIIFLLLSAFFAYFYQQTFFYLLLIMEFCLPFFSYFLSKYCFDHLTPVLTLTPSQTKKENTSVLSVKLINPSYLPLASAIAELSFRSRYYGEEERNFHVLSLRALSDNEMTFPVTLTKCGLYEASLFSLECFDYLHLFRFKKKLDLKAQVRVFPDSKPHEEKHEAIYSEGFDEFEESEKKGNISSNVTDIREYQPGDRPQKIHWKLSEKIDKLMVKENEATSTNEFLLLLELYQPPKILCGSNKELSGILDRAIEEAQSIALELVEAREIFVFSYYSAAAQDFIMSTIRCEEDFENALSRCFFETPYTTENLALDVYEKSGMQKGTLLHVTHKGVDDVKA